MSDQLEEIKKREAAATTGAWFAWNYKVLVEDAETHIEREIGQGWSKEDASFIAHSREDIPWMLEQIAALRAENERLEMLYRTQGEALDRENDALRARCEKAEAEREVLKEELKAYKGKTYCAYCGYAITMDDDASKVSDHILVCEKHPMQVMAAAVNKIEAERDALQKQCNEYRSTMQRVESGEKYLLRQDRDRLAARCKELEAGLREALVIAKQSYDAFPRESADAVVFKLRQLLEGAK
jgi:hypothetical protein